MKCYIRNVLLINPSATNGNIDCASLEIVVKNYPKHEHALVYVKEDDSCIQTLIGNVERIYIINNCLFGDISFSKDWKFVTSNLVYKPFPLATIAGIFDMPEFSHLDNIEFIDDESEACSDAIDLSKICGEQEYAYWMFNRPHYDSAQEATQPETDTLFKKKYDDVNSGFIGTVKSTRLEEKFTPVLDMRFGDNELETRILQGDKVLSRMNSHSKHAGNKGVNSEDAFHLQELHAQFHRYILKEYLSKISFDRD